MRSLTGLVTQEPLSVTFYRNRALRDWVQGVRAQGRADAVFVYSSSMLQYADGFDRPMVIDFADVDSAKWREYATRHGWPMSWVYRREAQSLLDELEELPFVGFTIRSISRPASSFVTTVTKPAGSVLVAASPRLL